MPLSVLHFRPKYPRIRRTGNGAEEPTVDRVVDAVAREETQRPIKHIIHARAAFGRKESVAAGKRAGIPASSGTAAAETEGRSPAGIRTGGKPRIKTES